MANSALCRQIWLWNNRGFRSLVFNSWVFYFINIYMICAHFITQSALSAIFWTLLKTTNWKPLFMMKKLNWYSKSPIKWNEMLQDRSSKISFISQILGIHSMLHYWSIISVVTVFLLQQSMLHLVCLTFLIQSLIGFM